MASQTQGIQQLLAAEKKAAEKVAEARKRKAKRLKQAKEEATTEIERFKAEKEKAFHEKERSHQGSKSDVVAQIETETNIRLKAMEEDVKKNKDKVINDLLSRVIGDVKSELHRNLRLG